MTNKPTQMLMLNNLQQSTAAMRIQRHVSSLEQAMQNYPLKRLLADAKGHAVETSRVIPLEERATRWVLAEMRALTLIAMSIPDKSKLTALFEEHLPTLVLALGFQRGEWSVRQATVRALGAIWGNDQLVPLLEYIVEQDKETLVRQAAVIEIASIDGFESISSLVRCLGTEDKTVRHEALTKLENSQQRRHAVPALENGLVERNPVIRYRAADVLENIGWQPNLPEMRAWHTVAKQKWDEIVFVEEGMIPALENALKGKDHTVRAKAADALDRLEWKPTQYAMKGWYCVAKQQWDEAVRLKFSAAAALVNALDGEESAVRKSAAQSLEQIGPDSVPDLVRAIAESRDANVPRLASIILGKIAVKTTDKDSIRINSLFIDAIPVLVSAIPGAHNNVVAEAALALADIAENISDRSNISALFDDALVALKEISKGQHVVVRQHLESAHARITRVKQGTDQQSGSLFINLFGKIKPSK